MLTRTIFRWGRLEWELDRNFSDEVVYRDFDGIPSDGTDEVAHYPSMYLDISHDFKDRFSRLRTNLV